MTVNDLYSHGLWNGTAGTPGSNPGPYDGRKLWKTAPNGYTIGPNYWGMTFYQWPPDPNNDWRQLYFKNSSGTAYSTAAPTE